MCRKQSPAIIYIIYIYLYTNKKRKLQNYFISWFVNGFKFCITVQVTIKYFNTFYHTIFSVVERGIFPRIAIHKNSVLISYILSSRNTS